MKFPTLFDLYVPAAFLTFCEDLIFILTTLFNLLLPTRITAAPAAAAIYFYFLVAGIILTGIIANRLVPMLKHFMPESHSGSRPNWRPIFIFHQFQKNVSKHQTPIDVTLIDLTKALIR